MVKKAIINFSKKVCSFSIVLSIFLLWSFFLITGLPKNANSSIIKLDQNFIPSVGASYENPYVYKTTVQSDGKILVGGLFENINGKQRINLARLNTDGTLDQSFNSHIEDGEVLAIGVLSNSKILVGGTFSIVEGQERMGIVRLNSDGSLDKGFSPNINGSIANIVIQDDENILVGGIIQTNDQHYNGLVRINQNGIEDASFNRFKGDTVWSIAPLANGKILLGLQSTGMARIDADGWVDEGFNPIEIGRVFSIAVQPDEKILIGGDFKITSEQDEKYLARINTNDTLDVAFNPNFNNTIMTLTIQKDGKILAGGYFNKVEGQERIGLARINPDGSVNPFKADIDTGFDSGVFSLVPQPDGKILVGGAFTSIKGETRNNIARFNFQEVRVLPGVLMLLLDD
jgi:uncharacterized delta-60 repeat protein